MNQRIEHLLVEHSLPSRRLDLFLKEKFPTVSRATLQRLLEEGHIKVDGKATKASHHPKAGEQISITWPETKASESKPEDIALDILFEDSDLIVLNKPPGIVVHPSAGHDEHTLVNALLHHCQNQLSGVGGVARPGIVHRLDKDTSGCLIVAKNDFAHLHLSAQFAERTVQKKYLLICCGNPLPARGEIKAGIARHPVQRKKMAVCETQNKRDAWTSFEILKRWKGACLAEATLHTGRTHQIRVHFLHLGFPVFGDAVYGSKPTKRLGEALNFNPSRQLLHAWKIGFKHPRTEKTIQAEAPVPADFKATIELLEKRGTQPE